MKKIVLLLGLLNLCVGFQAVLASEPHAKYFIAEGDLVIEQILTPAPTAGSKQDVSDFARVMELQKSRTDADCERAKSEMGVSLDELFGPKYGPLSADEVKKFSPLFDRISADVYYFSHKAKRIWMRPRPFKKDGVKNCVPYDNPDSPSYPSGHATLAQVFARALAEIDPKRAPAFFARAEVVGQDRVLGGVHYPSDVAAGKLLGDRIADKMLKNPTLLKELSALKL